MDSSRIILLLFLTFFIDISKENFIPERFGQVLEDEKNSGFSQTLLCYDNEFSGRSVMFTGYEPALGNVIFDNMYGRGQGGQVREATSSMFRISSCCFTGTWILYSEENYNNLTLSGSSYWSNGENGGTHCDGGYI